jgi:hypothetical protein
VAIALALVLAGTAGVLLSPVVEPESSGRVLGSDRPVNPGATDPGDISANNSPTLARNPRDRANLAVANRIDSPDFSCALQVSFDGGARWRRTRVPIPEGEGPKCYAPDVTFAADGALHLSYVTLKGVGNRPNAVWTAVSRDGGRTLSRPRRAAGPLAFQVRISAAPGNPRRLYLTWLQAREVGALKFPRPGNPIVAARSDDGGRTWSPPRQVTDPARERVLAPSPAVGPDGELYVLFLDVGDDRLDYEGGHEGLGGAPYPGRFELVLARSVDGGAAWSESVVEDRLTPAERFIAFLPPFPSLAVDGRRGRIYAAFHDARLGSADVWVWSLRPGAADWSEPVRVNGNPRDDGTAQYLPKLAVAPDGRLDVVYYDRREDPDNLLNEVSLQSSTDAGATFTPSLQLSSQPFDSRIGFGSERGLPDLGSRLGLVTGDDRAVAVWTDTRAGTEDSNKQDLARAVVDFPPDDPARDLAAGVLRYGGVLLVVAGSALALLAVQRRRRPAP